MIRAVLATLLVSQSLDYGHRNYVVRCAPPPTQVLTGSDTAYVTAPQHSSCILLQIKSCIKYDARTFYSVLLHPGYALQRCLEQLPCLLIRWIDGESCAARGHGSLYVPLRE